jgi:hypothetical protein
MFEQVMTLSVAILGLALFFLLQGCTQHKVDVSSSSVDRVVDRIAALSPPVQCRPLKLPPVPQDVVLDIQGDKVTANAGGELLLRGYVACRSAAALGTKTQ